MPLGLVCVLILWVTNLTSSLKNTSPSALSTYFLELANFECWRDDFKRKAPVDRSSSRDTVVACCCCCDGADDAATELMRAKLASLLEVPPRSSLRCCQQHLEDSSTSRRDAAAPRRGTRAARSSSSVAAASAPSQQHQLRRSSSSRRRQCPATMSMSGRRGFFVEMLFRQTSDIKLSLIQNYSPERAQVTPLRGGGQKKLRILGG